VHRLTTTQAANVEKPCAFINFFQNSFNNPITIFSQLVFIGRINCKSPYLYSVLFCDFSRGRKTGLDRPFAIVVTEFGVTNRNRSVRRDVARTCRS